MTTRGARVYVAAWVLAIVMICYAVTVTHAQVPFTWDGVYTVAGVNPNGSTYTGVVEIAKVQGVAFYQLSWRLADGGEMIAFGFEHGGVLAAAGLYQPIAFALGRNLEARWAQPDASFKMLGRETLTRTRFKTLEEAIRAADARVVVVGDSWVTNGVLRRPVAR